ncbi:capsular biosynthesis protein [Caballeronia sp. dw_19]|uniref:capsular polysaccharide export protein, LipB/KpsS family n=1 Tax=Caballeronia sp. dw_19 TaxID=2719791 RepID=UPI001BD5D040|nr:capsular biosynthesis protein [Caballeronia sp. dw_19]
MRAASLAGITRGFRLVAWLTGRSDYLWTDHWSGRAALRIARATGRKAIAAAPGPLLSSVPLGVPMLSWWLLPEGDLIDALNAQLSEVTELPPYIAALMKRVMAPRPEVRRAQQRVLLIDQREKSHGMQGVAIHHTPHDFSRMIEAARAAYPEAEFWLARSSDNGSGRWLSSTVPAFPPDIHVANTAHAALHEVDRAYTIGASEGMLALLANVPLHVYGAPYYAGWGLTHDATPLIQRDARPTLSALFNVVFIQWARYLDPITHTPGTLAEVVDTIDLQREVRERFADLRDVAGIRFQWWKRPFATPFLTAGGGTLRWSNEPAAMANDECGALWGARSADELPPNVTRVRIEDGFFHSCGLGSDMIAPRSQVIDRRGLYFDARQPSDLSVLLNETRFNEAELARAAALRKRIIEFGVTKYNLGRHAPEWTAPGGKQIVLVPGQVADDASIRLGTSTISTADTLLREVRARRPNAFIVYKPHPDVLSGNRSGLIDAQQLADVVDTTADLLSLIDISDEVHTLSSLAGFDALMREKAVFTYGLPFYAGWGLTHDALAPLPWRERTLSLDMLTAGALLRYPIYWDWRLRIYTTPEAVVHQLAPGAARPLRPVRGNRLRPFLKSARWLRNALYHTLWQYRQKCLPRK